MNTDEPQHGPDTPKGERTEWVTRKWDADGALVSETVTAEVRFTPQADAQPEPGFYL